MSESFEKAVEAAHDAATAWLADMRGDLPGDEMVCVLTAALPHLTAEDVPHLTRQAKTEAWEVGRSMGLSDHSASMRAGRPLRTPNPYAEEADHEHA